MSAVKKASRRTSNLSVREYEPAKNETYHNDETPKPGTKRLFSNRESRIVTTGTSEDNDYNEEGQSGKRHRSSDWPLSNATNTTPTAARSPPRSRSQKPSSVSSRHSHYASYSLPRPSRFLEGSMNDRVSSKPPLPFIDGGELQNRKIAHPKSSTFNSNASASNKLDQSRQSGIFRFGRSIAASFNPSNWKIFASKQPGDDLTSEQKVLKDRQERAEKLYKELKQLGQFRDSGNFQQFREQADGRDEIKHDSAVVFDDRTSQETTREEKRMGRVFLEPPQLGSNSESPASGAESLQGQTVRKGSFHFNRASLPNLKRSQDLDGGSLAGDGYQARRMPSRKDLQKQQKLVKRVSDLEGKLDAARRQLEEVLGEPLTPQMYSAPSSMPRPKGRPRFVPGALSTLPSERLLSGYVSSEAEDGGSYTDHRNSIGQAIPYDPLLADTSNMTTGLSDSPGLVNTGPLQPLHPSTPSHLSTVQSCESDDEAQNTTSEYVQSEAREDSVDSDVSEHLKEEDSSIAGSEPEPERDNGKKAKAIATSSKDISISKSTSNKNPKKRKNAEVTYKPEPESESDVISEPKSKKPAAARPRKLAKKAQDTTPFRPPGKNLDEGKSNSPQTGHASTPQKVPSKKLSKSGSLVAKTALSNQAGHNYSPPTSSSFTGLQYTKPSLSANKLSEETTIEEDEDEDEQPHAGDIPPVPKMPKAVRLPSGEIISTETKMAPPSSMGASAKSKTKKVENVQPKHREGEIAAANKGFERSDSFQWDEDVF